MEHNELLSIIEGMLFLSGDEGLTIKQISSVLQLSKKETTDCLDELIQIENERKIKGFELVNFGGVYKFATLSKHHEYYQRMVEQNENSLSNAALETLAIIAYNQPITRVHIEEIRGVGCDAMIRKLVAKALIKEVGREDTPGKPILYGVTDEFMDAFSLTSLDELPELKEMKENFDQDDIFNTKYTEDISEEQ
ncbi:SMC-Scp complex subunit ScpB [Longibaculum muris]|uniref:SMC-Scp complex subunit ScpB n=1 Tax=Longibaculum muris TaxID=1796628 RepID=UPI0012B804EE|nr:SMC-Scp complex subunit ScpB [Longibaculum muris]